MNHADQLKSKAVTPKNCQEAPQLLFGESNGWPCYSTADQQSRPAATASADTARREHRKHSSLLKPHDGLPEASNSFGSTCRVQRIHKDARPLEFRYALQRNSSSPLRLAERAPPTLQARLHPASRKDDWPPRPTDLYFGIRCTSAAPTRRSTFISRNRFSRTKPSAELRTLAYNSCA